MFSLAGNKSTSDWNGMLSEFPCSYFTIGIQSKNWRSSANKLFKKPPQFPVKKNPDEDAC